MIRELLWGSSIGSRWKPKLITLHFRCLRSLRLSITGLAAVLAILVFSRLPVTSKDLAFDCSDGCFCPGRTSYLDLEIAPLGHSLITSHNSLNQSGSF